MTDPTALRPLVACASLLAVAGPLRAGAAETQPLSDGEAQVDHFAFAS